MCENLMEKRLVELLQGAYDKYINLLEFEKNIIAKHLVENGVFAPPCKPGDKAYFVIEDTKEVYVSEEPITDVSTKGFFVNGDGELNLYESIGKTVFLNPDDAEKECQKIKSSAPPDKDYDFEEICPHCDFVNEVVWDGKSRSIICAGCGKEIVLCSACEDMRCGNCRYEKELSKNG